MHSKENMPAKSVDSGTALVKKIKLLFVFLLLTLIVSLGACGSKLKLSQPAYRVAMGLLNTCARKDPAALAKLRASLENQSEVKEEQIADDEKDLLLSIIKQAEDAQWEKATERVRQLLDYQATSNSGNSPTQRHQHR